MAATPEPAAPILSTGRPPCAGLALTAAEIGLATSIYRDGAGISTGGTGPASISVTGLPPGLRLGIDDLGNQQIMGRPTTPGTYTATITAIAQYNNSTQTAAATLSFTWVITAKPVPPKPEPSPPPTPVVAVYDGAGPPRRRPAEAAVHDRLDRGRHRHSRRTRHWPARPLRASALDKLDTHQRSRHGKSWVDNCKPSCAGGRYSSYPAKVALTRPKYLHGHLIFTRLTFAYTHGRPRYMGRSRSSTAKLQSSSNSFGWG